jgi:hypothetical protein
MRPGERCINHHCNSPTTSVPVAREVKLVSLHAPRGANCANPKFNLRFVVDAKFTLPVRQVAPNS